MSSRRKAASHFRAERMSAVIAALVILTLSREIVALTRSQIVIEAPDDGLISLLLTGKMADGKKLIGKKCSFLAAMDTGVPVLNSADYYAASERPSESTRTVLSGTASKRTRITMLRQTYQVNSPHVRGLKPLHVQFFSSSQGMRPHLPQIRILLRCD